MANPIKFPFQNFAFTCADIPGCETLHVQKVPDAELVNQFISAHQLDPDELASVNQSGGIVWLGIFGAGVPPLKVYGSNPWANAPGTSADATWGGAGFAEMLTGCASPAEFMNLWHWYPLEARATTGARAAYREAEQRWPQVLYPLDPLPTVTTWEAILADPDSWRDATKLYPPKQSGIAAFNGPAAPYTVVDIQRDDLAYSHDGFFNLEEGRWYGLSTVRRENKSFPLDTAVIKWRPQKV
jgi:hypothetical protein